jgi:hypothetical protein
MQLQQERNVAQVANCYSLCCRTIISLQVIVQRKLQQLLLCVYCACVGPNFLFLDYLASVLIQIYRARRPVFCVTNFLILIFIRHLLKFLNCLKNHNVLKDVSSASSGIERHICSVGPCRPVVPKRWFARDHEVCCEIKKYIFKLILIMIKN